MAVSRAEAAESVTVPPYEPAVGAELHYRVQKTTESDMSLWFDRPEASSAVMRGDFRQSATVLSRDEEGMRMKWRLSADVPPDATGAADSYAMNAMFRNSLAAYGVAELEFDADPSGAPTALVGADRIIANMEMLLSASASDNTAARMLQTVKGNPLVVIDVLAPESMILALGQSSEAFTTDIGQEWTVAGNEELKGTLVPTSTVWKLEAADKARQTATFSATVTYDPAALLQSQQSSIDSMIASFSDRAKQLTDAQLAQVRSAGKSRTVTYVNSTRDGSTIEVLENTVASVGGMKVTVATHIWREDQPPVLPAPHAWTAETLSSQRVEPLPENNTQASIDLDQYRAKADADTVSSPSQNDGGKTAADGVGDIAPISLKVAKVKTLVDPSAGPAVEIVLTPESAKSFEDFTRAALGQKTQLLVDGDVVFEPVVREPIVDGNVTINGLDSAQALAIDQKLSSSEATIIVRLVP
ncbi:SecDF P1 head subdomain-containing protein [Agrobacterium sp. NPDC089420]|uniref:SecDF P1 head subdomain-containing protein n=1 Tax=Agrobacterium sp. NPDC089420 TaxID=3363918 RepID=UPI00384EC90F